MIIDNDTHINMNIDMNINTEVDMDNGDRCKLGHRCKHEDGDEF